MKDKNIYHEIKNQISVCDLYTEIIRKVLDKKGIEDETLTRAVQNIKNSLALIADCASSLREVRLQELRLANLIADAIEICKAYNPEKSRLRDFGAADETAQPRVDLREQGKQVAEYCFSDIKFVNEIPYDTTITADKNKFTSALVNIMKNAIEAGATEVKIYPRGNDILIENNGEPIPTEIREKIFEDGFTTKETGTGFGLMLTQKTLNEQGFKLKLIQHTGVTIFNISRQ